MAAPANILIYRGSAPTVRVRIKDKTTGAAVDVTGWTGRLTLRPTEGAPDPPALQKAWTIDGSPALGTVKIPLTRTETLTLSARNYAYSIARDNDGFEDPVVKGVAKVEFDIYHAAS
jgi:hypothetical protein